MIHDFVKCLHDSKGVDISAGILEQIMAGIPGATDMTPATEHQDRQGTDWWVLRANGLPSISVDMKNRNYDPIEVWGKDDVCIETCSVYTGPSKAPWLDVHRKKLGWTLDTTKRTDLVVFTWPTASKQRRFWILYFPHLCTAARAHWQDWAARYHERPATNDGYVTLSVYPPRLEVARAMRQLVVGVR